ncbi:glycosyltransferase family 2 protein, partial [Xenorhabdus innexi]
MKNNILSIIITAHNIEKLIPKCLDSIEVLINNNYIKNMEILLIDDKSSDQTGELMSEFSKKSNHINYIRTEFKNIGKVRNYAISLCTGKYVTFIDGDDTIPNFNFNCLISLLKNNSPDILLSKIHEVHNKNNLLESSNFNPPVKLTKNNAIKQFLIHKKFQAHLWGKVFKKSLFNEIKIPEISCYEDSYVFPKLLESSNNIYYTNSIIYNYIKRENSLSMVIDSKKSNIMADVIIEMDSVFGKKYRHLVATHAIDHILKNGNFISNKKKLTLFNLIKKVNKISYLLDINIRLSYKRKLFKLLFSRSK